MGVWGAYRGLMRRVRVMQGCGGYMGLMGRVVVVIGYGARVVVNWVSGDRLWIVVILVWGLEWRWVLMEVK